jgi:hypothetical protein
MKGYKEGMEASHMPTTLDRIIGSACKKAEALPALK